MLNMPMIGINNGNVYWMMICKSGGQGYIERERGG